MKKIKQPKLPENKMDIEQYKDALNAHDWTFEWSDDHNVWTRGIMQRQLLNAAQKALDADCSIWNSICHKDYVRRPTNA